jgi:hypothetical protein
MFRWSLVTLIAILLSGLSTIPAGIAESPRGTPPTAPVEIPAVVNSDFVLFAQLNVKELRESAPWNELQKGFLKAGGKAEWDHLMGNINDVFGLGVTDLDRVTVCLTDLPERGEPVFIVILNSSKALNLKNGRFIPENAKPDANGFYQLFSNDLVHLPNEKTAVFLHKQLSQKYLDGCAKNPAAWPFTPELTKAAAGQTFFATVRPDKVKLELMLYPVSFAPLLAARGAMLTAKLDGKELRVAGRAAFANAVAAGKGAHKVHAILGMIGDVVDPLLTDGSLGSLTEIVRVVVEAERALATAKVEVVGSDVTVTGVFNAEFPYEPMAAELVKF